MAKKTNQRGLFFFVEKKKKNAQKIWSKDLVYEKTFQLSNHTPGYSLMSCPGQVFLLFIQILRLKRTLFNLFVILLTSLQRLINSYHEPPY